MAHYRPFLRSKAGEATALRHLSAAARARIGPLVNMTTNVSAGFINDLSQSWTGRGIALDGSFNFNASLSVAGFNNLFAQLGQAGVHVIPSVSIGDPAPYLAAALAVMGQYGQGLVVQVRPNELGLLVGWLAQYHLTPAQVNIVISAGDASPHDPAAYGAYVAHAINANLPTPNAWASKTLHAYCAPRDYAGLPQGRSLFPRRDWQLWQRVNAALPALELDFSDCAHVHPSLEEVPGVAMARASVSVRYAVDDNWIIRKGVQTSGPQGVDMTTQFRAHAVALTQEPLFNNLIDCWADNQIAAYAAGPGRAGGREQWVSIGINRHLSLVADRLP